MVRRVILKFVIYSLDLIDDFSDNFDSQRPTSHAWFYDMVRVILWYINWILGESGHFLK